MTKPIRAAAAVSLLVSSGSAFAEPKPVPQSMLQGTRLVSEKYNFAAEAPRFDWVWKMEKEGRDGASFVCEAPGDPLASIYVYSAKLAPGEGVDRRTIEGELKKGLAGAGLQVLGTNVDEVRPGVSYNFVASISMQGQTFNAIGIIAVGGELFYIVFHFRLETTPSDAFTRFTQSFTLLNDPGLADGDADADGAGNTRAYMLGKVIGMVMTALVAIGVVAVIVVLVKRAQKR